MWRSSAHEVVRKKGAVLMSDAPAREPNRRVSSLMSSLRIMALQRLQVVSQVKYQYERETYLETAGAPDPSGNGTSSLRMLAKVALRFLPLKGVVPYSISYIKMPRVHQSTALVCPQPLITSGAMYSSVPTNEFVLKFAIQDLVSIVGKLFEEVPLRPLRIIVGRPPVSDCFDRSKSDNIMWPD
jgi:hypothetical protein